MKQRKKVIPLNFQRKKQPTLKQILSTAARQRRIRELIKNNKTLARALEESQCVAASNNLMLQNYLKDSNQILLARIKINDMAQTIQKLVADLNDVAKCLDINGINTAPRPLESARVISRQPDLSRIDETLSSIIEETSVHETTAADEGVPPELGVANTMDSHLDSSVTEVYNVQQLITTSNNDSESQGIQITDQPNTLEKSPHTPQLNLHLLDKDKVIREQDKSGSPIFKPDLKQSSNAQKKSTESAVSKIPIRKSIIFVDTPSNPSPPVIFSKENRRETFVVSNSTNHNSNLPSASLRRGTFTITELMNDMSPSKNSDRRGTFVIPAVPVLPPVKPQNAVPICQTQPDLCPDERTLHLSEDMDLTEVIPSITLSAALNPTREDVFQSDKSCFPFMSKTNLFKPTLKIAEQISPIAKISIQTPKSTESENKTNATVSANNNNEKAAVISENNTQENVTSKPGLLNDKISSEVANECQVTSNSENNSAIRKERSCILQQGVAECLALSSAVVGSDPPLDLLSTVVEKPTNKLILDSISIPDTENILVNLDPDIVKPAKQSIKKFFGRKSLKPSGRMSLGRKNSVKRNSVDNKVVDTEKSNVSPTDSAEDYYEFSPPEGEVEAARKTKAAKNQTNRNSSKNKAPKNKDTLTMLEQDINLNLHEQVRRKRSMKRKVSFAASNQILEDGDLENEDKNMENRRLSLQPSNVKGSENILCLFEDSIPVASRRSILKKTRPSIIEDNYVPSSDSSKPKEAPETDCKTNNQTEKMTKSSVNKISNFEKENKVVLDTVLSPEPSELIVDAVSKSSKYGKRTCSGVSERSSKRKFTGEDFLGIDDIDIVKAIEKLSTESRKSKPSVEHDVPQNRNCASSSVANSKETLPEEIKDVEESVNDEHISDKQKEKAIQFISAPPPESEECDKENCAVNNGAVESLTSNTVEEQQKVNPNTKKKRSKSVKQKKSTSERKSKPGKKTKQSEEMELSESITPLSENHSNDNRQCVTPRFSKSKKSGENNVLQKENVVDLESGGRSRRARPYKSLKEPSLNVKMRRQ